MKRQPTAIQAIRRFCLYCQGSIFPEDLDVWGNKGGPQMEYRAVRECPSEKTCPLWPFRMGKNPNRRPLSPEKQQAKRAAIAKARAARSKDMRMPCLGRRPRFRDAPCAAMVRPEGAR